ncbi:hypothetical protein JHK86_055326 [Glycine max]|nr:hypothetical protein JHK86_055326 [Glycine max]
MVVSLKPLPLGFKGLRCHRKLKLKLSLLLNGLCDLLVILLHGMRKNAMRNDKMLDSIKEHGRVLIAKNEYFVVPFTKRLLDNRKDVGTWSYFEAVVVAPKLGYPKENFKLWWKQNDECFEDGLKLIIEDQQALELAEYAINHNVAGISS